MTANTGGPGPEADIRRWLERAVIGLNLCPFAKGVYLRGVVCFAVSQARDEDELLAELQAQLIALKDAPAESRETTLLIIPQLLPEFLDFNDFLERADGLLRSLGLEGIFQIASFHPRYQFAGTATDDITNFTNRSPYAVLHLLREASIGRAVMEFSQSDEFFERNMQTLRDLGHAGWAELGVGPVK